MNRSPQLICVVGTVGLLLAMLTTLSAGEIELRGVNGQGSEAFLSLKNTKTSESSWVAIGGRFSGYTVKSYDPKKGVAQLERDGSSITVQLATSTIVEQPVLTEERREEIKKSVLNNLRQLSAAAEQYYLENGVAQTKYSQLVGKELTNYIKEITPADGEDYSRLEFKQGKPLKIKTPNGIEAEYKN